MNATAIKTPVPAPATVPMPTLAETPSRGLLLPCPCCGEASATICLNLADGESLNCQDCGTDFTASDVRDFIAKWTRMLAWIETMPTAPAAG